MRIDQGGEFWDIVFDVVSLVSSVIDVCKTPTDPMAWASLAGDVVDLVPFVTGVGETVKVVSAANKVVDAVDTAHDVAKAADKVDDVVDATKLATKSSKKATEVATECFLPDEFYTRKADLFGTPNSRIGHYKYNPTSMEYEYSDVFYDFAGRQHMRIDYTDHGRIDHGSPHIHFRQYGKGSIDGQKFRLD